MHKLTILAIILIFMGCSNASPKTTEPMTNPDEVNTSQDVDVTRYVASVDIAKSLDFPLSDKPYKLSGMSSNSLENLRRSLLLYYLSEGEFPTDLKCFAESGYPLFWPRDTATGNVVLEDNIMNQFDPKKPNYGFVQYENEDERAILKYIRYDSDSSEAAQEYRWRIDEKIAEKKNDPDTVKRIYVNGGLVITKSIADKDKRKIYTMCGQLTSYIIGQTSRYLKYNDTFPSSFDDLLDARLFIIKENFGSFKNLLSENNVDFKWGFDNASYHSYFYMTYDSEAMISLCIDYDPTTHIPHLNECTPEEINMMTSPINNGSLDNIMISDEYLVSLSEIID